jgi:pyrroline-5-carboxylate reductase
VSAASLAGASVALAGGGKMGLAMLEGWAAHGLAGPGVLVLEPAPSPRLSQLCADKGYRLAAPGAAGAPADALVLAIKPQMLDAAAPALQGLVGPQTFVLSILAGKRLCDLSARFAAARAIVRAMPNTPAAIGRGIAGAFASAGTSAAQRALADALLAAVGGVEWLDDEAQIDAVTAVSGSGPAYVFYLVEALAAAGVAAGLAPELSARLARATVEGSGELLRRSPEISPETFRQNVTSPGGTTAAALAVLMAEDGLAPLMERAVAAAKARGAELAG